MIWLSASRSINDQSEPFATIKEVERPIFSSSHTRSLLMDGLCMWMDMEITEHRFQPFRFKTSVWLLNKNSGKRMMNTIYCTQVIQAACMAAASATLLMDGSIFGMMLLIYGLFNEWNDSFQRIFHSHRHVWQPMPNKKTQAKLEQETASQAKRNRWKKMKVACQKMPARDPFRLFWYGLMNQIGF